MRRLRCCSASFPDPTLGFVPVTSGLRREGISSRPDPLPIRALCGLRFPGAGSGKARKTPGFPLPGEVRLKRADCQKKRFVKRFSTPKIWVSFRSAPPVPCFCRDLPRKGGLRPCNEVGGIYGYFGKRATIRAWFGRMLWREGGFPGIRGPDPLMHNEHSS